MVLFGASNHLFRHAMIDEILRDGMASSQTYWEYYDDDYDWGDDKKSEKLLAYTRKALSEAGFSSSEAETLISSGYVVVAGNVIDRFYGGMLLSSDSRSRIRLQDFRRGSFQDKSRIQIYDARSMDDVLFRVDEWSGNSTRRLLFRGQIDSFAITRPRSNPAFAVEPYGEISLLPSLWRKMLKRRLTARHCFQNLHSFEWLRILQSTFDMREIERRTQQLVAQGEWIHSAQDLEDSGDPLLQKFGGIELDLLYGAQFNLATCLQTLLQHYGLMSPVLDLTSDLDVALFFATHRYRPADGGGIPGYDYVGSNRRKSVLYVLRENATEMQSPGRERLLNDLTPLRPIKQSCVVCRSGPDAMNLAADFLFGVIRLDFDDPPLGKYHVAELFPGIAEDRFLSALKTGLTHPEHLTIF